MLLSQRKSNTVNENVDNRGWWCYSTYNKQSANSSFRWYKRHRQRVRDVFTEKASDLNVPIPTKDKTFANRIECQTCSFSIEKEIRVPGLNT